MSEIRLSRAEARRIAVRAQLLDAPRPTDLLEVVQRLAAVQVDLTAAVAPSADLVCWSRLGRRLRGGRPRRAVPGAAVVELRGFLRPAEDISLFRAEMAQWPGPDPLHDWQRTRRVGGCQRRLPPGRPRTARVRGTFVGPRGCRTRASCRGVRRDGPTTRTPQRMLDFMEARGEVAVVSREGRERQWDLASRVFPETGVVPVDEALAERARRRLAALGVARAKAVEAPGEPHDVGAVGEVAVVEGVRGTWQVDPADRPPRRAVRRAHRAAVPVGPARLRPQADDRAVRVRLPAGDVQAGRLAPLGLLGAADPARGPARREGRRYGRPARPGC